MSYTHDEIREFLREWGPARVEPEYETGVPMLEQLLAETAELRRHVHDLVCLLDFADRRIPDGMQVEYLKGKHELKATLRRHHKEEANKP